MSSDELRLPWYGPRVRTYVGCVTTLVLTLAEEFSAEVRIRNTQLLFGGALTTTLQNRAGIDTYYTFYIFK